MDFNLKQWREHQQHESEEHREQQPPSAKIPRLLTLDPPPSPPPPTPLPLFVTEPTIKNEMSASPSDSTPTKFPRVGSYFSLAQLQELEVQALIFKHMLAGAAIPPELLHLVKKSLFDNTNPYFFTHPLQHFPNLHPSLMQSGGYRGIGAMYPEPSRCRRTDGKKWRCSRDVMVGHKYCDRHIHRGRNRSRKPVEIPTPLAATSGGEVLTTTPPSVATQPVDSGGDGGTLVGSSGPSPSFDLLKLNNRSSSTVKAEDNLSGVDKSGNQTLRHFFDDWTRSPLEDSKNIIASTSNHSVSDFSLKLSTGTSGGATVGSTEGGGGGATWVAPMGGPLAEALRSSTSNSSPTSVLHH